MLERRLEAALGGTQPSRIDFSRLSGGRADVPQVFGGKGYSAVSIFFPRYLFGWGGGFISPRQCFVCEVRQGQVICYIAGRR